jgi:hypothetical protein
MFAAIFLTIGFVIGLCDKSKKYGFWLIASITILWGFVFGPWAVATFIELVIGYLVSVTYFNSKKSDIDRCKTENRQSNEDSQLNIETKDNTAKLYSQRLSNMDTNWIDPLWEWTNKWNISLLFGKEKSELLTLKELQFRYDAYFYKEGLIYDDDAWLEKEYITELPKTICNLPKLEVLRLGDFMNLEFYVTRLKKLPKEIGNLKQLTYLEIQGNGLSELPSEIGKLTQLEFLDVSYNDLTELPSEIGNLKNLKYLSVDANNLLKLPVEIVNLTNLERLEIGLGNNSSLLQLNDLQKEWIAALKLNHCEVY